MIIIDICNRSSDSMEILTHLRFTGPDGVTRFVRESISNFFPASIFSDQPHGERAHGVEEPKGENLAEILILQNIMILSVP